MNDFAKPQADLLTARPTTVRWRIVILLMAFIFASHFHRISMPVAGDERIMYEFCIRPTQMGWVYSAFLISYTLCMTPGGWFIDRFGPKTALVVMGFGSAVFGALTGLAGLAVLTAGLAFASFLLIRCLMGAVNASIHPASAHLVGRWLPFRQRAWGNGLSTAAAPLGIAAANVGFAFLIDATGWRVAFLMTGLLTAVLATFWLGYATDRPEQHPSVNEAERDLILGDQLTTASREGVVAPAGWRVLLGNRSLALLTVSYAAVGYFEYLFFYWMGFYFKRVLQLGENESRFYSALPPLAMVVGLPLGGWLSDRLVRRFGYRRGRALVPAAAMAASALFLYAGIAAREPGWILTWFSLALAAIGACEGPFWATAVELGGRRGGTSAGICNTGGNLGGILGTSLTPWVSEQYGWYWGLSLGSLVCLLGVGLWYWIDPAERAREDPVQPRRGVRE
jgi:sugar phosphate permease